MNSRENAEKIFKAFQENGFLRDTISFDELYDLAKADTALEMEIDKKLMLIAAGLYVKPEALNEMRDPEVEFVLNKEKFVENFDISTFLSVVLGAGIVAFGIYKLLQHTKTSSGGSSRSHVTPTENKKMYLFLAVQTEEMKVNFPDNFHLSDDEFDDFFQLPWYLLTDQSAERRQELDTVIKDSFAANGFLLFSIEISHISGISGFRKGNTTERKAAFRELVGMEITKLGVVAEDTFRNSICESKFKFYSISV